MRAGIAQARYHWGGLVARWSRPRGRRGVSIHSTTQCLLVFQFHWL